MRGIWGIAALAVVLLVPGDASAPPGTASAPPSTAATAGAVTAGAQATVYTAGGPLNVRAGASLATRVVTRLPDGSRVRVLCKVYGQSVRGPARRSAYWDRLGPGRYVADAYLRWRRARPGPARPDRSVALRWCGSTGGPTTATVASAGGAVNARSGPGSRFRRLGRLANGRPLFVRCQRWGDRINGPRGATNAWYALPGGRYVAGALVAWAPSRPALPWCGQAPPTVPAAIPTGFLDRVSGPARLGMRRYRVPASVTIAQAILESGWGRSRLTRRDHNYFGIKCFGEPGPIALGCRSYPTHECGGGRCWRTRAQFRAYRNAAGSMADHGRFLVVNPRYRGAFRHTRSPDRFARAIHRAGYATSPTYARNLIRLMRRYDLYRYDR
jgi:flagellar protein FlgJ